MKFTVKTALCNNWPSYFKKFWSSYRCESEISPGTKVVHHVHLHNILEGRIFSMSITRKVSTGRKVRNQDAKSAHFCRNQYSKNLILLSDNLETKCCLIKKESFNLVQKYKSYEGSKSILWNSHLGFTRSDAFFVSKPILFFKIFCIFKCRI